MHGERSHLLVQNSLLLLFTLMSGREGNCGPADPAANCCCPPSNSRACCCQPPSPGAICCPPPSPGAAACCQLPSPGAACCQPPSPGVAACGQPPSPGAAACCQPPSSGALCCQPPSPGTCLQQPTACDICSTGCKQSPIDICSGTAVDTDMTPLKFTKHWMQDICLTMTVARDTVLIKPPNEVKMTLEGGPLRGSYVLDQLHFHWGDNDRNGSEHSIDGQKGALEAHLVYYSSSYCSIWDAMGKPEGIAMVAVLMQSKPTFHNCHLDPVISNLCRLKCPGSVVTVSKNVLKMFREIFESQEYFAYEGSLSTSPCSEEVIWMVFKNYLCIHCSQVEPFRKLTNEDGRPIRMNWRPTQPLNGRTVYNARTCPCPCS